MKDAAADRAILADSVVFHHVSPSDLDPVIAASEVVVLKPGELILSEGTPGDGLYIVLEGEVEIFLPQRAPSGGQRASRIRLNRLGPGRCLGEYGLIDDRTSSASAAALTPVRLCFLPKATFRKLVERHDHLARIVYANLLGYLVSRLRGKDRELDLILLDDKR
jgi:CRP/FNR family transcriptional regulator, cyclic AMP receptor protein